MRPIIITNEIFNSFKEFVEEELSKPRSMLNRARQRLIVLQNEYLPCETEYQIINAVTLDFKQWLLQLPNDQAFAIDSLRQEPSNIFYNPEKEGRDKKTPFCIKILTALNYPDFRKEYAHKFTEILGVNACPY